MAGTKWLAENSEQLWSVETSASTFWPTSETNLATGGLSYTAGEGVRGPGPWPSSSDRSDMKLMFWWFESRSVRSENKKVIYCQGGYKEYRALVRDTVQSEQSSQMEAFKFILLSGNTGNGKSRILEALREAGEQVLHLEELAKHKGEHLMLAFLPLREFYLQDQCWETTTTNLNQIRNSSSRKYLNNSSFSSSRGKWSGLSTNPLKLVLITLYYGPPFQIKSLQISWVKM